MGMRYSVFSSILLGWALFLGDSPTQTTFTYDTYDLCQIAGKTAQTNLWHSSTIGQTTYRFSCVPDNDSAKELVDKKKN
jgi:hypothetical protein